MSDRQGLSSRVTTAGGLLLSPLSLCGLPQPWDVKTSTAATVA